MTFKQAVNPWQILAAAILMLLSGMALAQTPGMATPAMTNDDVVKLAKLGFGNDVIEAKIEQAGSVDFKLEVDDLLKLKAAGVSQEVISAMLRRSSAAPAAGAAYAGAAPGASAGYPPGPGYPPRPASYSGTMGGTVTLVTKDHGGIVLHSVAGTMSTTFAYVTSLIYANFSGLKADARIQDPRPTLLVRYPNSPKGRFYLVSAEVDTKNNERSVKQGNSGLFSHKNLGAPDSDNQIEYDVAQTGADQWQLTPRKDLKPGEYGLWVSMQEFYDFGVDPP
ncbi:MAG TPA: hypothetical protein VMB48_16245 [Steroidobacteraceae bacterium]|nr:hypothetical protein [Steroidobacteraceae bacterium]